MVVGTARPELLDTRPGWGSGKPNATTIALEPLGEAESREMILNLLDRLPLSPAVEARITRAVDGNPLFTEELVAMLVDEELLGAMRRAGSRARISPSCPSRRQLTRFLLPDLEGLPSIERAILTAAAVEGAFFHRSAVSGLTRPAPDALEDGLLALVRRGLIRPEAPSFAGEDAYRFRHALIRDAAYRSVPKNARADLHERFAAWLELAVADRLREFEEVVGYHLEQAFQYRTGSDRATHSGLARRPRRPHSLKRPGGGRLSAATSPAAVALLERVCPSSYPLRIQEGPRCLLSSARR